MIIEILIALCLLAALVVFLVPDEYAPVGALAASLFPLVTSFVMWWGFDGTGNALVGDGQPAFETSIHWIDLAGLSIQWHVGVDGISMPLIVLTTVLTTLAILTGWTPITERRSAFYGLLLFLEAGLVGVFSVLDFFTWLIFWEVVLVPMYLLIGIWGGPRRKYAAIKFFVYTNIGTLVMFIGVFALVFGLGDSVSSLEMPAIAAALRAGDLGSLGGIDADTIELFAFVAMFVGFAVKVPLVPFHTWLPDAYVEAPTPVVIVLSGVLAKMGTYALLRFNFTMMPDTASSLAVPMAIIAVISVIYGALLALAQQDLKRIVAYASITSMGYVLLGLVAYTVYGIGGATFQMLSHGLLSGLLFACVGVIYNETRTRMVGDISGLADRMQVTAAAFVVGCFAYMGLPFISGFAAEFFVFRGAFGSGVLNGSPVFTAIAMFGIVIVAGYFLFAMQRTLFGEYSVATDADSTVGRAAFHDIVPLVILIVLAVVLGTAPDIAFGMIRDAVGPIMQGVL